VATIDMGRKEAAAVPFRGGGAGSPSNTMWPRPRSTSVPSGVFIHPAVWRHNRHGPKIGVVPFLGEAGTPFNTTPLGEGSWVPIYHNVA